MYIRVYKLTVMYFGLTNFSATFQTIMNDLFHDLINQKKIATFIDNIIVTMDTKERHNKLVGEVLKKPEENNLCRSTTQRTQK